MPPYNQQGITFSSVTKFLEQVGRRMMSRQAQLDQMTTIFNGPTAGALSFKPKVGDPHPSYPLMFCLESAITDQAALVSEIQATYEGIMQTGGAKTYTTPPILSFSPVQGSRDFVEGFIYVSGFTPNQDPIGAGSGTFTFNCGTITQTVRYIGRQVSIKYQTYPQVGALHYAGLGLGSVTWQVLSTTRGPAITSLTNTDQVTALNFKSSIPKIPDLFAANLGLEAQQRGKWWDCTEIYGPTF